MADVIFDEEQELRRSAPASSKPSAIERIVYKSGLAKTHKGVQYVLLVTIIVRVLISIGLLVLGGSIQIP